MIINIAAAVFGFGCGIVAATIDRPGLAMVNFAMAALNIAVYLL